MIQLTNLFQDDMIIQRGKPISVSGSAEPGALVCVEIQGRSAESAADGKGQWCVTLPPLDASDSETLNVTSGNECLILHNVAVGEIWIAGGQSNMEFWMRYEEHRKEEGQICPNPRLRFYDVPKVCYEGQLTEFDYSRMGIWRMATDEDLDYFSATAYYFQKELAAALDIPVGIIGCNWGGTISAAWMNPETVERVGQPWIDWFRQVEAYQDMKAYLAAQHGKPVNDHGNPFGDLFLETVLPRTLSEEEAREFLFHLPDDTAEIFDDYMNHSQPQSIPGSLYEYMVKTVAPFPVRGVLWYQGEGDDEFGIPEHYQAMLTALIGDWRELWNDETMPFLIVQIPGCLKWLLDPPGNNLMEIRRCQERVCDTVPDTWLCSGSDAGAETDAHPKDKTGLGHYLTLLARSHIYGEAILGDAPRAVDIKTDFRTDPDKEKKIRQLIIPFVNTGDGLSIKGDHLNALSISAEGKNCPFEASVEGDRLILTINEPEEMSLDSPVTLTVSFAQTSWYDVNLYNSAGIPAIPFEFFVGREYSFYSNKKCKYFPCHPGADSGNFNCLFCYCPLYMLGDKCGGDFVYNKKGIKDCTGCLYPHRRDSYDDITARYGEIRSHMAES